MALKKNILIIIPREPYFSRARKNNTRILYEPNLIGFPVYAMAVSEWVNVCVCVYPFIIIAVLLLLLYIFF